MNVFITGSTGRLGSIVAKSFKDRGDLLVQDGDDVNYMVFCHRYRGPFSYEAEMFANVEKIRHWINSAIWAKGDTGVVLVTSVSATDPARNQSLAYNLSKACQEQMVRVYSRDMKCNAVAPNTFTGPAKVCTPEQVANVILFLCSPQSSGINGQSLRVG